MSKKNGTLLMAGGLLLIAAALFLTCYNEWDERRAEAAASTALAELSQAAEPSAQPETEQDVILPDYILNPEMEMPTVELDGQDYIGVLTIPALGLELPVISEWSYPRLKVAPCRFQGSAYLDDLIIAAHNYRSHFGSLGNLRPGDEVTFTDVAGNVFRYTVMDLETLGGNDLEELESGQWDLTLLTCTYGGKSRVVIRCQRGG